jgi:hypothetical protein
MSATSPDVTLSITYDMPRSGVLQYGFVPCAGFFGAEPTPAGKALIADWLRMTEVMFDDQIALTEILLRQNAVWEITEVRHVGATTTLSTENGEKARVTMLDPHTARRSGRSDLAGVGEAVIWHPRWIDDPEVHKLVIARLAEMDTSETPTPRRA